MAEPLHIDTLHITEVTPERLVDWKNPPQLRSLKQDFQDAQILQKAHIGKLEVWLENLNVTGKAQVKSPQGSSAIVPKLIRKQAEWRYAALSEPFLSTEDLFNVRPTTWEDREAAAQNELVLNHQFLAHIDRVTFIDEFVRAAVDEGTVILRTGWNFEEEEVTVDVPDVIFQADPFFQPTIEHIAQLREESPSDYQLDVPEELKQAFELSQQYGVPYRPIVQGWKKEKQMKTTVNHPTVEICNLRNVTMDPACQGNLDKANFVVYSFESSLAELRRDKRYKNLDHLLIDNNSILGEPDHTAPDGIQNFNFTDKARKKFVVYEYSGYWDIHGNGTVEPFIAAWVGNVFIRLEALPFPDKKLPYVAVKYLPVRKALYGEPDGALLEDNQKVAGAVTRGMIDLLGKSANGQTGMRRDMLDLTNKRKFDRGLDYEFNPSVDPRVGVYQHVYPEIPQSAQFMLQLQQFEAESLTGVKSFNQGISGQSLGDVAAGVRGALDASSKRELGILRRLSQGIVAVGRKVIAMNAEFLSDVEVIRITNEEFVEIHRDDLAGNFDLRLSISTAEEDANKVEKLGFLLQTTGPNMDPALSKMILSDIAKLQKMPDLAKKIEAYEPQPDPLAERLRMAEVLKLEAEAQLLQAQVQKTGTAAQLDMAKAGTEEAKQDQLRSESDLSNLDFVEQESGVKHARDMESQGAQAQAQIQLKLAEHQLAKDDPLMQYKIQHEREKANTARVKTAATIEQARAKAEQASNETDFKRRQQNNAVQHQATTFAMKRDQQREQQALKLAQAKKKPRGGK